MKKRKQQDHNPSGPPAYYNGTPQSVEWILEQYRETQVEKRFFEKYSYLPRESFHAILFVLGRLR